MISGAGLCWQHVGGVGSTTTTTTTTYSRMPIGRSMEGNQSFLWQKIQINELRECRVDRLHEAKDKKPLYRCNKSSNQ